MTVSAAGFGTETKQAEQLVNQPSTVNFTLGWQSTTEINVSEEIQTLNDTDATLGKDRARYAPFQQRSGTGNHLLSIYGAAQQLRDHLGAG